MYQIGPIFAIKNNIISITTLLVSVAASTTRMITTQGMQGPARCQPGRRAR